MGEHRHNGRGDARIRLDCLEIAHGISKDGLRACYADEGTAKEEAVGEKRPSTRGYKTIRPEGARFSGLAGLTTPKPNVYLYMNYW